jgi:hypothetical protein
MLNEKDTFEGAIRAKEFPIIMDYYLKRAQEMWKANNWPIHSASSDDLYVPPFLESVVDSSSRILSTPSLLPPPCPNSVSDKDNSRTQKKMHSGVLWKLGQGIIIEPWAQRYFVLDYITHTLTYYSFTPPLANDDKKVKKGEISLENKRVIFYRNENKSWNPTGLGESYIIDIIYLKSVAKSSRSNMILLTNSLEDGREWASALTYVAASSTSFLSLSMDMEASVDELRDQFRDSLASYLGYLPDENEPPKVTSILKSRRKHTSRKSQRSHPDATPVVVSSTPPSISILPSTPSTSLSDPQPDTESIDETKFQGVIRQLIDFLSLIFFGTFRNIYEEISNKRRIIVFPLLVFLLPQQYQVIFLLVLVYILIYSDVRLYSKCRVAKS